LIKPYFDPRLQQALPGIHSGKEKTMTVYKCTICDTLFDEAREDRRWDQLADDWVCSVCASGKSLWRPIDTDASPEASFPEDCGDERTTAIPEKSFDELETSMADIRIMAETGHSIIEPMRTRKPGFSWDDILIMGAQLARQPLNPEEAVDTLTVIGPKAAHPLVIDTPVFITHMSFGALSREAKLALAQGSAAVHTAMCSGEGGILPESMARAHKYIFEYVPNRYSVSEDNLQQVDAVEIKIGQSAKPGMGGHLPAEKVTPEIAALRGFAEGVAIKSPARFDDIRNREDLKAKVDWLRKATGGKPVGIKLAAGHIEADLAVALYAAPDFITIDGRAGATGASPKFVKAAASVPTIFALYRARTYLDANGGGDISLVITGGLRISADFAKALAMGADAIAIGTAALVAIGCRQFRVCNTGRCPTGIATQDPDLRARLDVDAAARELANYLRVSTAELKDFARLTGKEDVHALALDDLCTTNSEISRHTAIAHV
jgi:glutamate synthase domain-containing protein 2/DNA-directed RNA polymerase subunit RPC12/RpoP